MSLNCLPGGLFSMIVSARDATNYEVTSSNYMDSALARIKRVAKKQTTVVTHYGRKSGQPHQVTIWFVVDGDHVYIGTANANRNWVKNVQKTPRIRMAIGGETFAGSARFLSGAEHERAMAAIRRKYWMFSPFIQLLRLLAALGIVRDSSGSFEVALAES